MEEKINLEDVDNFLDGYKLPELHKEALINLEDVDFHLESKKQCLIPQVDGLDDISIIRKRFSVNCESEEVVALITFFRSFEHLWNFPPHDLCVYEKNDDNCFFCLIRSSCVRINSLRATGPKSLKIVEFASQLTKYQVVLDWDWRKNKSDMTAFIENTLKLLKSSENSVLEQFIVQQHCSQCETCQAFSKKFVIDLHVESSGEKVFRMEDVVSLLIKEFCNSCQDFLTNQGQTGLVILRFPCLVSIQISDKVHCKEQTIKYISHISEEIYVGLTGKFASKKN